MKHPSDQFYEQCAIECLKTLAPIVDIGAMTPKGWEKFVGDVFDLADALSTELTNRLERNARFREKNPDV